jgi:hypothetical protein
MAPPNGTGRRYVAVGLLWFLVALGLGATGRVASWRPPVPQLVLVGLTVLLLVVWVALPSFRRWLLGLDLRWLIALHLTRYVGIYFLIIYYRDGALPRAFAVPGGWGDIVVATLALGLVAAGGNLEPKRWLVGLWNTLGLIDILFVVATASRLAQADPDSMNALLHLPLSLLPTFLVPLLIADHVLIFWRVDSKRTRT